MKFRPENPNLLLPYFASQYVTNSVNPTTCYDWRLKEGLCSSRVLPGPLYTSRTEHTLRNELEQITHPYSLPQHSKTADTQ